MKLKLLGVVLMSLILHGLSAQKFEAENFTLSGGAVKTSCSSCSGSFMVSQQDGNLSYTFSTSTAGYVNVNLVAASTGGSKVNILDIDGNTSQFTTTSTTYTTSTIATTVRLNAGSHTLKITKSWGWINIDYIQLISVAAPVYNINTSLVTANPTTEAKCLYNFLRDNYGKKIVSGVMEQSEATWIKQNTGKDVVLVGTDFLFTNRGYTWYDENTMINDAINQYKVKGGITEITWHWRDPSRATEEFYWQGAAANYTTFDVKKINEPNSAQYNAMISDIDYTAGLLKRIRDQNVPVLWRPLHEAAGGWFWWGRDGASCKKLWQIMYDRLVNYHGLKNLIWVWTKEANDDAFYPGDAYVDIVGRDYYYTGNHTSVVNEFTNISATYGNKKLTTITECGSFPDPDNLVNDAAGWSWFMVWTGDFVRNATYNPLSLWNKALNHSYVLTLDEMPNIKTCSNTTTVADGTYKITAKHSGKSLNVQGNLTTDGGNIIQYTYGGGNNEKWYVKNLGNGEYSVKNVNSGKALDVSGASTADLADINQWTYYGSTNQKWKIQPTTTGYFKLVNINSNKCVDIPGSVLTDADINQYTCNGGDNQSFLFEQLSTTTARVGIDVEDDILQEATVFPNPSQSLFVVRQSGEFTFTVHDILGNVREKGEGIGEASFGKSLSVGTYILKVQAENSIKSIKIIKTQ